MGEKGFGKEIGSCLARIWQMEFGRYIHYVRSRAVHVTVPCAAHDVPRQACDLTVVVVDRWAPTAGGWPRMAGTGKDAHIVKRQGLRTRSLRDG